MDFLSHDDVDHTGNLDQVVTACPNARGVDAFATPLPDPHMPVADLDAEFWRFGMTLFAFGAVSPWLAMVDHDKSGRFVDTVQDLDIATIAACHTPVIEGPFIQQAFDQIRSFPSVSPPPLPDQSILDQIHRRHRRTGELSPP